MNLFYIKIKHLVFAMIMASLSMMMACSNTDALIEDPNLVRQDSIDQSILDNAAIDSYIAENNLEKVITAASGIRYALIKDGNGEVPDFNDIVSLHYIGKFLDNEVFDTSNEQAAISADIFVEGRVYSPIRFNFTSDGSGLTGFVPGFGEGITKILQETDENNMRLFSKGGKAILLIPSALAYGINGSASGLIPPNTVIAFELSLVSIRP